MTDQILTLPVPVLIVEDEPMIQERLKCLLISIGYAAQDLFFADTLSQSLTLIKKEKFEFSRL